MKNRPLVQNFGQGGRFRGLVILRSLGTFDPVWASAAEKAPGRSMGFSSRAGGFHGRAGGAADSGGIVEPANRAAPAPVRNDGAVRPAASVFAAPGTFGLFSAAGRALRLSGALFPGGDRLLPALSHAPAFQPASQPDCLDGGVFIGRRFKAADPGGDAENAPLGQRLCVAVAALQRMAARQLSVFESGPGGNAAGVAGSARTGGLPVFSLAAGHGVPPLGP